MDDDADGRLDAVRLIRAAGFEEGPEQDAPLFDPRAIAAAAYDLKGQALAMSPAFRALKAALQLDERTFGRVAAGGGADFSVSDVGRADGARELAVVAYGRTPGALSWRIPPEVRTAAERCGPAVIVLTTHSVAGEGLLESACRAFGLTALQTRVAVATMMTGNVRLASRRVGVSYDTAREALAAAFRRTGVTRLPAFIARLAGHAFGVLPDGAPGPALADLWGLTPRQAAIAALVGQGASRTQAAASLALGPAVVRKELEHVFQILQVSSAAALARKVIEAQALRWIVQGTQGDVGFLDPAAEPLQYVLRDDGGRIAVSDYGPAQGRPVLVVHSSMTSRIVGRRLLRALHEAGFRPIAIDRPGFGLTDEHAGMRPGAHDPYATAAQDAVRVLDRLRIPVVDLAARGGAQFVVALQRAAPHRLGGVVLVNPDPHTTANSRNVGPYGVLKEAYRRNPAMIRLTIRLLARGLSYERTARMMQAWMRGSAPDELAITDPDLVRDYYHAQRMFALGKHAGYVNEQTEFVRGRPPPPMPGLAHWQVLVGENDTLHDPEEVLAYWTRVLPDAQFHRAAEGGRLLALSHPELVVAALRRSIAAVPAVAAASRAAAPRRR